MKSFFSFNTFNTKMIHSQTNNRPMNQLNKKRTYDKPRCGSNEKNQNKNSFILTAFRGKFSKNSLTGNDAAQ